MPYLDYLKPKSGEVIRTSWGREVVEWIERIGFNGAIDYYGYVHKSLIPDTDLIFNLGDEGLRFLNAYVGYGYFTYDVFIQGKRALKDGDPIYIADLYPEAIDSITQAIDNAKVTAYASYEYDMLMNIHSKLLDIEALITQIIDMKKPSLLAKTINQSVSALSKVFTNDIIAQMDGKLKIGVLSDKDVYLYTTWIPAGETTELTMLICNGELIKANVWKECERTINKDDKINIKVDKDATVTVFIWNVGEA